MSRKLLEDNVISIGPLNLKATTVVNTCVQCKGPTNLKTVAYLNKGMDKIFRRDKDSRFYVGNATLCSSNCIKAFLLHKAFELKYPLTDEIQNFVQSPNDNTHVSWTEYLPYEQIQWVRDYNPVIRKATKELKTVRIERIITLSTYGPKNYPYVLITVIKPEVRTWYSTQDSSVQFFTAEAFNEYKNNLNMLIVK